MIRLQKKMVNKQYITYKQYLRHSDELKRLENQGIEIIHTKSMLKMVLGGVCLVIAIIPNWLGIVMYPLGFSLLASGGVDIVSKIEKVRKRVTLIKINLRGFFKR